MFIRSATLRMPQRRYFGPTARTSASRSTVSAPFLGLLDKILLFSCLSLLILAVWLNFSIRNLSLFLERLQKEEAKLEAQNVLLVQERERVTQKRNLERVGARLGLHAPGPGELAVLKN